MEKKHVRFDWPSPNNYNPFDYVEDEEDVQALVTCLVKNGTGNGGQRDDAFWETSERNLLYAIVSYMRKELPPEERTLDKMRELVNLAKVNEADPAALDGLDILFREVEKKQEEATDNAATDWAATGLMLASYHAYRAASPATRQAVIDMLKAVLATFQPATQMRR